MICNYLLRLGRKQRIYLKKKLQLDTLIKNGKVMKLKELYSLYLRNQVTNFLKQIA